ncbi:MAG: hypothetical protein RL318_2706 [Fibrobacterota bacterium]
MIGFKAGWLAAVILGTTAAHAAIDTVEVRDGAIPTGGTTTWTHDKVWRLNGTVFVRAGAKLAIEAGTTVLGSARQDSAAVLVIARGGRIHAEGTARKPVIFTSELDPGIGALEPTSLNRGLWGGLVILGRAPNNNPGGVANLSEDIAGDASLLSYGDSTRADIHDTSGVLRYVSVRYTGINELKGVILASVGDGTVVDHLEAYCGADDGIDLLGGTVNLRHLVSGFHAGDALFYSEGYRGAIQYMYLQQKVIPGGASNGVNMKLESGDTLLHPVSIGRIWNATVVGTGVNSAADYTGKYKHALHYKKDGAGTFANSIVTQTAFGGVFVDSSKLKDAAGSRTTDSLGKSLLLLNNLWSGIGRGDSLAGVAYGMPIVGAHLLANGNSVEDPLLGGISWLQDKKLDPRPAVTSSAWSHLASVPADGFLETPLFRGAFGRENWAAGWTALSQGGFFSDSANVISTAIAQARRSAGGFLTVLAHGIELNLAQAQNGRLELVDLSGRIVFSRQGRFEAGRTDLALPALTRGMVVARFQGTSARIASLITRP